LLTVCELCENPAVSVIDEQVMDHDEDRPSLVRVAAPL